MEGGWGQCQKLKALVLNSNKITGVRDEGGVRGCKRGGRWVGDGGALVVPEAEGARTGQQQDHRRGWKGDEGV